MNQNTFEAITVKSNSFFKTLKLNKIIMNKINIVSNTKVTWDIEITWNTDVTWNKKIKLYKDIFWEAPWNEWFICQSCNLIYPKKFAGSCSCWNSKLNPFYKNKELKSDFKNFSLKDEYQELIAKVLNDYIWFIWWWNTTLENLNNNKLWLTNSELENLTQQILEKYPNFNISNFYYFSEIWVENDFRGKDIAWKLYRENLQKLCEKWEKYILVRTTRKSDLPYKWFKKMWYKEVYLYEDKQDRVILVYKIKSYVN